MISESDAEEEIVGVDVVEGGRVALTMPIEYQ